ncbi:MAG: hypothetical protein GW839_08495 [Flavobacteriales bacterium]|nr:hypothetical protein [Flavobacteriia bacterium]NCP53167.1 hypothetical protein [Flavobacteriales bacterium]PIV94577.1 MAG: hypothetical protein COW44_03525 [Flavobacteriaceae bacterium CG17_big_fil_post_rev_8_21_14_2_50_33_15]PJB17538.1 MAG: hypothetical protein CO117_11255 [Flavobacteriaceae bacterium CG_4_9_14_3_um_filter_33_16]NCP60324.1 hypothetical protein [Flavobacteriales bacterium]
MYSETWDKIINTGNLDLINNTNFTDDITLVTSPENIVGIDAFKDYYSNFLTGFSDVKFTIVDAFGQGDKLVKHWNFKGTNTGPFFGMPATGKTVDVDGATLVKMKDGKIAQEQDFMDNMVFLQQLGIVSSPENVGIIDNLYKAFGSGDIPMVLVVMDDHIVWNEAEGNTYADGNPYIGPDAVLKSVFSRIGEDHEYFKLEDIQLHDMSNNQVLATLRYDGKLKKNRATYNVQAAHLWTLENGKITAFQQYVDTKKLNDALKK